MASTDARAARSERRARLLVAIGGVLVVFVAGEIAFRNASATIHWWADALWTLASAFAAFRCWRTASGRARPHQRRAWRWLAAGCGAWCAGMLVWSWYELAWGVATPFPTLAEIGFLALPLCFSACFFYLRADAPSEHLTLKQIGDLGVVLCALAIASALVLYAPAADLDESPIYIATALAYPVFHLGAFAFGLMSLWQHPRGGRRRIVAVLLAGKAVLAMVTAFYSVSLLTRTYEVGDELDVFWILGFALVVWASYEEEWRDLDDEVSTERVGVADLLVFPIALLTIAIVVGRFHDRFRPELAPLLVVVGTLLAVSAALRERGVQRIERALREEARREEGRHRRLLASAPIGIAQLDASGRVVVSNARFDALIGTRSRELAQGVWEDVGLAPLVRRVLSDQERVVSETPLRLGKLALRASLSPAESSPAESSESSAEGALVIIEDVTDSERLQTDLLQSQKMQAVGTLAGGIAHDFNNLLSGMIASISLLRRRTGEDSENGVFLDHMEQSMWRAAELTRHLLGLSRRRDPVKSQIDVTAIVERVVSLLARSVDENIVVRAQLPAERIAVLGDAGQLEQALLNLGINARDAMRPKGGDLRFSLALEQSGANRSAVLRVIDGGAGIPTDIRDRIFDPFFTTKDTGEGTGLGLAMVYAFVHDHGGTIEVDSEVGRGTTITMRLPAADVVLAPPRVRPALMPRGKETILVVDDRDTALFALKTILGECGYTVVVAGNGVEALAEIERRKGSIQLVITDAMMRRMGGRELLASLRRRGFTIPIVLATGHDAEAHLGHDGFAAVLRKPFDPHETACVVREALDSHRKALEAAAAS